MHLLIDGQTLQTPNGLRGIGRFATNLALALARARPGWRVEWVLNRALPAPPPGLTGGLAIREFEPPAPDRPPTDPVNELFFADWLTARSPDAVLLPDPFGDRLTSPHFVGRRPPLYAVLHDLIPLLFADRYLTDTSAHDLYAGRMRRLIASDGLLANSEATAADWRRLAGPSAAPVWTIGGGVDPAFAPIPVDELPAWRRLIAGRHGIEREFVLYVGGWDFRKNLPGAMRAFAATPAAAGLDLVVVCVLQPAERAELERTADELGIRGRLRLPGYVGDEELKALYHLCRVFFFPSLYEGLGLPLLEAQLCGAPVVAGDNSSLREYAGPAGRLADASDTAALAVALGAALAEPRDRYRAQRVAFARGFRWADAAEIAAGHLGIARQTPAAVRGKPRVAWASPLPPCPSGIADYSADLLGPLSERFDIELVVDPDRGEVDAALARRFPVVAGDEAAARHAARPYDLFVFQLGNSGFHVYMLPLLRRFGGVVVVHDFHLGGLLGEAIRLGTWPVGRAEALEQMGEGHVANWLKLGAVDDAITPSLAPQVRPFVEHADALVVHSAWAWERLRDQSDAPVLRVPMAVPLPPAEPPSELRARFGLPPGRFLVGTLGHVYYHKRMPTLLRAVAGLPADLRARTEVVVVGPAEPVEHDAIVRMAGGLGIGGQLRMVGHVSLEDLHNYARACDVCVQLRYPTHGETSAALLRAMAAGAACVTSAVGPLREIPNHAAWKVRSPAHEVSDLTAALVRLAVNPAQRGALGRAARAYMAGHHAPGETAARYAALMDQAIAKRTARGAGWAARAGAALAGVADAPALAGRWAALRAQGQASALHEITRAA